jgi:hypothetical protein
MEGLHPGMLAAFNSSMEAKAVRFFDGSIIINMTIMCMGYAAAAVRTWGNDSFDNQRGNF